ncbi:transposase family protein [Acidipropionibacterium jensenii]|nr:transposase family protein [Acidipropionibacterium jensenii]
MTELVARVHDILTCQGIDLRGHRLGLYRQVELTLVLLRQDMVQMCAADLYAISQPSVSRIWRRVLPLLDEVLAFNGVSLQEAVAQGEPVLVDGTFIPTGNRPASGQSKANYSGKHHVQCLNIQVAGTLAGDLIATSEPAPGSRHDSAAIQLCGWQEILHEAQACWIADTAYIATTAITPIKKTPGRDRLDWEKTFNHDVSSLRSAIEHIIGQLKNWKILAKGYRGRLSELPTIIRIVTRLELYRIGW